MNPRVLQSTVLKEITAARDRKLLSQMSSFSSSTSSSSGLSPLSGVRILLVSSGSSFPHLLHVGHLVGVHPVTTFHLTKILRRQ